jgi:phosphate transport system permease protein
MDAPTTIAKPPRRARAQERAPGGEPPAERARHRRAALFGESMVSLCGGALALNLLLVIGLLVLLAMNGLGYFWPRDIARLELADGRVLLGEIYQTKDAPRESRGSSKTPVTQVQIKVGNRDLFSNDFIWIGDEAQIRSKEYPKDVVVLERIEYGNFYGTVAEVKSDGAIVASGAEAWKVFQTWQPEEAAKREESIAFEKRNLGPINEVLNALRVEKRWLEKTATPGNDNKNRIAEIDRLYAEKSAQSNAQAEKLLELKKKLAARTVVLEAIDKQRKEIPVSHVVRAIQPNNIGFWESLSIYGSRVREFIFDDPRESNTEGGIFPAIFGTVLMVFLMSIAVVPLGVLAALYLREYAKNGPLVRVVRIAVNNLAGVPSIVFGVFGLGFFVYLIGGTIDHLFYPELAPTPKFGTGGILWSALTLALLTVPVVIVATEEGLAAVPRIVREGSLAMGATKFETTWRLVVPAAAPGILTGLILAMARAAGEVAPLMIVGMVKLAPALPVDGEFPFLHAERKFMHLGFHIYDVGFQSPNVDATKPIVFATALLLIIIITIMNLAAIGLRNHLRRKYAGAAL